MTDAPNNHVKMLFRFYSHVLDEWTVETMWAEIVDSENGIYKLDSIPFYAPLIASDDIIHAEFDETEQMLTYRKTVEYSGNSTISVVIMDKSEQVNKVRELFKRHLYTCWDKNFFIPFLIHTNVSNQTGQCDARQHQDNFLEL